MKPLESDNGTVEVLKHVPTYDKVVRFFGIRRGF